MGLLSQLCPWNLSRGGGWGNSKDLVVLFLMHGLGLKGGGGGGSWDENVLWKAARGVLEGNLCVGGLAWGHQDDFPQDLVCYDAGG